MPYTMRDLLFGVGGTQASPTGGVCGKVSFRQDIIKQGGLTKLQDAILELSRSYRFGGLERTGPTKTLTPGQYLYPMSFFTNPTENNPVVNLIPSFYVEYVISPSSSTGSGTNLLWKTIDTLELMLQLQSYSNPAYFTRYNEQIYLAPVPQQANPIYMRYQVEHPFASPVSLDDIFLLPNEWKEIAEYAAALRFATDTRMLDFASQYHNILYGDPKEPGKIGLIEARISQNQGDSISMPKQIRVAISRY